MAKITKDLPVNTDTTTLVLIEEIKKRKSEIAKIGRTNNKTDVLFSYTNGDTSRVVNLNVESNVQNLVLMAAHVINQKELYEKTAADLGVESPPVFKWNRFSIEDWVDDIKNRIAKIQVSTKQKTLEKLEVRLNSIISPELRAKIELQDILKELE